MKIYTKKGDTGTTQLIGGTRVPKHHVRIEAYGTVDELNSWIGWVRDQTADVETRLVLKEIQDRLFTIGSLLASDPETSRMKVPDLHETDVAFLESEMDRMDEMLPEMKSFILPGGNSGNSICHIARCVCRRNERLITSLAETETVSPLVIKYMNRLSDYLFVLARKFSLDASAEEVPWKPRL
ncbi:MAG: cob(I)yrinic acid a,c-diamide adenosyltransferase [Chitinophagales bacterium]|nr:cob(I)yrinic acid a,c-diamide adenosyltransferase [Chitinophagaceae bacterium]MBP9884083.1 cob(I)yrinic acid a,c-diamide adenosyltransferase [Chitinophagales bacterium]